MCNEDGDSKMDYRHLIKWNDIELAAKVNPEQHANALKWISFALGYLPPKAVYMPYLAIVQSRYDEMIRTQRIDMQCVEEDLIISQQIRNDDIKKGGWLKNQLSDEKYKHSYEENLPMYKHKARVLLCENLSYEPLVEHSFEAEIYMRHMFTMDDYHEGLKYTPMEMKAMAIAHYRRLYYIEGEAIADRSDLIGLLYNTWKKDNGYPIEY